MKKSISKERTEECVFTPAVGVDQRPARQHFQRHFKTKISFILRFQFFQFSNKSQLSTDFLQIFTHVDADSLYLQKKWGKDINM